MFWKALWAPGTPLYLKAATVFAVVYLICPFDTVPDFIPLAGWIDDVVIVPLLVSWIVSRLPGQKTPMRRDGPIIDGTARRV